MKDSVEGLNGVKHVAWNVQQINHVSWKREKINQRLSWIFFVQITVLFVAFPKLSWLLDVFGLFGIFSLFFNTWKRQKKHQFDIWTKSPQVSQRTRNNNAHCVWRHFEDKHIAQADMVTWRVDYWCIFLAFLESVWSSWSKVLTMSVIKAIVSVFNQGQEKPIER